jgi:predicted nucleic acid-binding protein
VRVVFADTSFFVAICNPNDNLHAKAKALYAGLAGAQILTTELVFIELLNYVSGYGTEIRQYTLEFIEQLENLPNVEVLPHSSTRYKLARARYQKYSDKSWSLVDCDSMLAMVAAGTDECLTYDYDFVQAGKIALMR